MKPLLTALFAGLLAGTLSAQKVLPLSDSLLAHSDAYEVTVKGRGPLAPIAFGPYRLVQSWEQRETITSRWLDLEELAWVRERKDVRSGYSFLLTHAPADSAVVVCLPKPGGTIRTVRGVEVRDIFTAVIRTNGDTARWEMIIEQGVSGAGFLKGPKGGTLTNGRAAYRVVVHPAWKSGKKPLAGPAGFEFFREGSSVAAVQLGGFSNARVWITTGADSATRFLLAAAAESLLLWASNGGYEEEGRRTEPIIE